MPDGILIIDKPAGWTSMDVCAKLRGVLREKRVGHAGTLDPMATGVLPVFVGQATKAIPFAETGRKEYEATLRLGLTTDTQDSEGTVLTRTPVRVGETELREALGAFVGTIAQIPPMYSAVRHQGKRLYELARAGVVVERKPREVTIYDLVLTGQIAPEEWTLRVACSRGTYVRTLCHDIGAALGCGGVMSALRRTASSGFRIEEAVRMEDAVSCPALRPIDALFRDAAAYRITSAAQDRRCRCGNPLRADVPDGLYRVYGVDGAFLALSRAEDGRLTSVRNFFTNG